MSKYLLNKFLYTVDRDQLSADVEAIRKSTSSRLPANSAQSEAQDFRLDGTTCRAVNWGAGVVVPIEYGEQAGGLVFREPKGDTQVADVYLCGDRSPVRSLTLPVP